MLNQPTPANSRVLALLTRMLRDNGRAYLPRYAVAFIFMGLVSVSTALTAWMMKDVINKIFVEREQAALFWLPIAIIAIFTIKGVAAYYQEISLSRIGNRLVAEMQKRMFDHILAMDIASYQRLTSSDLITRITQSANSARQMMHIIAVSLGRDLLTLVGLIIVMATQDPLMSAICLGGGPIVAIALRKLIRRIRKVAESQYFSIATIVAAMRETSQGIKIVKAFQLEDMQRKRMFQGIEAVERLGNKIVRVQARVNPLAEILAGLAISMVVLYAGWRNLSYGEAPGGFFAFIAALLLAADPVRRLSKLQLELTTAAVGVRMMYDLIDAPAAEKADARPELVIRAGEIRFEKVSFAYDAGASVLNELEFIAPAGRVTAVVGISGGGKTTIFNLLQRFWTPERGTISIDGQSLADVSLKSLRSQMALVSQDVFLFEGTIRDNIWAGRPDASEDEVITAARAADADDFIRSLPHGYDTQVGELGAQVSGGQRQRIALARAFVKRAPIILLDEPTSALDSETELVIQRALKHLARGRTTLVIAHRLATVLSADLIIVVDGGRVIESGTHSELLRANGLYARLYQIQFKGEAEAVPAAPSLSLGAVAEV